MFTTRFFRFNGVDSKTIFSSTNEDEFLYIVKKDKFQESIFGISRKLVQDFGQSRAKPFLYGFKEAPLTIKLRVAKQNEWTFEQRQKLINWLITDNYKELIFYTDDEADFYPIAFYCLPTGTPKFKSMALENGFMDIEFTCDAPHGWATGVSAAIYDLTDELGVRNFQLTSISNIREFIFPEIEISIPNIERRTVDTGKVVEEDNRSNLFVRLLNWPSSGTSLVVTKNAINHTISNPTIDENILYLPSDTYAVGDIVSIDYEDYTISLLNTSDPRSITDGEKAFVLSGLKKGETIKIDNEHKLIGSSLNLPRVENFNKHWLRLYKGINNITIEGSVNLKVTINQPMGV